MSQQVLGTNSSTCHPHLWGVECVSLLCDKCFICIHKHFKGAVVSN